MMSQLKLIELFKNGATEGSSSGGGNLKICGDQLIHFSTVIAERCENKFIVNMSRYSMVTGTLQKKIKNIIGEDNIIIVTRIERDYQGSLKDFIKK